MPEPRCQWKPVGEAVLIIFSTVERSRRALRFGFQASLYKIVLNKIFNHLFVLKPSDYIYWQHSELLMSFSFLKHSLPLLLWDHTHLVSLLFQSSSHSVPFQTFSPPTTVKYFCLLGSVSVLFSAWFPVSVLQCLQLPFICNDSQILSPSQSSLSDLQSNNTNCQLDFSSWMFHKYVEFNTTKIQFFFISCPPYTPSSHFHISITSFVLKCSE